MGSIGDCYHLYCPYCGEYFIAIPAEVILENNPQCQKKKAVLSGMAFESYFYQNKPIQITPDLLAKAKDISLHEKLFKLAAYFYREARENNAHLPQNPACCYQGNDKKYSDLMNLLKELSIINYRLAVDDSTDYVSSFIGIEMTPGALLMYENGINNIEEFKEAFMNNGKNRSGFKISYVKQFNVANDQATITALQINNSNMQEYQKLIENLLKQIPIDTPDETKTQITDSIDTITQELNKSQPKHTVIKTILGGMKELVNATGFASSLITLGDFISNHLLLR
jgi:hypothetical protein